MSDSSIDLRIKAERLIRADRISTGRDVRHLNFEQRYKEALQGYLAALQRINRLLDHL